MNIRKVKIDFKGILIGGLVLLVFVNMVFFKYVYSTIVLRRHFMVSRCRSISSEVSTVLDDIEAKISLFREIGMLKYKVQREKEKIKVMKKMNFSKIKVSRLLNMLLLKSGASISSVRLVNVKRYNHKVIYFFSVKSKDTLSKIVKMMSIIEDYGINVFIPSYTLTYKGNGIYDVSLSVKFMYVSFK